jgi:phage terminase large subunit-like protein
MYGQLPPVFGFPIVTLNQTRLKVDDEILYNKKCFAGLDLASTRDIAALVLCFPVQQGLDKPHIKSYFFCPEDNVRERSLIRWSALCAMGTGW